MDFLKKYFVSYVIRFENILGTSISSSLQPLYIPGFAFIVISLISILFYKMNLDLVKKSFSKSFSVVFKAGMVLIFALPLVRLFIHSGNSIYESMPVVIAGSLSLYLGGVWSAFAPVVGSIGSFISGSNTVSNLMFASLQNVIALENGISTSL